MDTETAVEETEAFFVADADRIEAGGADDAIMRAPSDGTIAWEKHQPRRVFRCRIQVEEEETGYSAYVPALPGVLSEGETLAETLANIAEAIIASLESYLSSGDTAIPWKTIDDSPEDEGSYWLAVNV